MTRYERRLAAAREDAVEILKTYDHEIAQQKARMNTSSNSFIKTCCRQGIESLTKERIMIEKEIIEKSPREELRK